MPLGDAPERKRRQRPGHSPAFVTATATYD